MIMIDQSKRLREPLRWTRAGRAAVLAAAACAVLAAGALGVYAVTSGAPARADCVQVTFASTLGGAKLQGCGQRARVICASGYEFKSIADSLRQACRHAGFPFRGP
ncbi:MAG TPA: hypothetical protein VID29_07505 [Solirubrobacteraceae bacterium]|jgi:hypothetical protein